MLGVAEASAAVLARIRRLERESIKAERCVDRVLADDITARVSMPPWDNSAMDGYAVRSDDVKAASETTPIRLRVTGDIPAGRIPHQEVSVGEAMRIMTGAPVPKGADCVIRLEDTDRGLRNVLIQAAAPSGRNVRFAGEDFRRGDTVLRESTALHPAHVGVLASLGISDVAVYGSPRVAIISSGDELVLADRYKEVEAGRKIVSTNNYTLTALVEQSGGIPVDLGIANDSIASLREKFELARDCDLIITTAGVSVGEKDFTREAFTGLGGELVFWKVRMRPGAPLAFGFLDGKPWLGLSGNPVSAMVTFLLFVRPVILKMLGHTLLFPGAVEARIEDDIATTAPLTHFLRGILSTDGKGSYTARLSGSQSSGVMTALARANALIVVPEDVRAISRGDVVTAIPITGNAFHSETLVL